MKYAMAVLYELEGDEPIAAQDAFIKTLPENALYVTNPLICPDGVEDGFDIDVHYYTPRGVRLQMESIIGLEMRTWVYSTAYIAHRLGLTEDEVLEVLEANS